MGQCESWYFECVQLVPSTHWQWSQCHESHERNEWNERNECDEWNERDEPSTTTATGTSRSIQSQFQSDEWNEWIQYSQCRGSSTFTVTTTGIRTDCSRQSRRWMGW